MKSKIIFLSHYPLIEKREEDFYVEALIQAGIPIEYWDLSKIFFPDVEFNCAIERDYVKIIYDYKLLEEMIAAQDIKKCFFITLITFNGKVIKLNRLLTTYNCFLILFARGGLPDFSVSGSLLWEVFENPRNYLTIDKLKQKCLTEIAKLYKQAGLIKNYDLVFAAGAIEQLRYQTSEVIPINHFDYDKYRFQEKPSAPIVVGDYCVFLDDNIAYDADFKMYNIRTVTPTRYTTSLCTYFDMIEDTHAVKVVIAAHPKSVYRGGEFGNREIIKGKTDELVRDCHFTVAHYSTSISFSILYRKPIVFTYTNEMKTMIYYQYIIAMAQVLDAQLMNIDEIIHDGEPGRETIKAINHSRYEEYKYKCLTSRNSENRSSCDVVLQTMIDLINS